MKSRPYFQRALFAALLLAASATLHAAPQLPDFVYQGKLEQNGAPANGNFNLDFALFDAAADGNAVGAPIALPAYPVVNGLFSVSLAFPGAFTGTQLYLQVSVNGTPMLPRQPVATAPVAQFALSGTITGPAGGDLAGNYPDPTIAAAAVGPTELASFAVTNSKLAPDAVSASKIADGAVGTSALAGSAVTAEKIAGGAVGTSELANDSVTRGKIAGGYSNGAVAFTVGANDCNDYNLAIPNAQVNDMILFTFQQSAVVPANMTFQPLRVPSADTVAMRVCNLTNATISTGSLPIYVLTLR